MYYIYLFLEGDYPAHYIGAVSLPTTPGAVCAVYIVLYWPLKQPLVVKDNEVATPLVDTAFHL